VQTVFADGGHARRLVRGAKAKTHATLEILRRMPWMKGFVATRSRWAVERADPWIMRRRRLAGDYGQLPRIAEAFILTAASSTLVRRWPRPFSNTLSALPRHS
jgi:transposase